jgi:putative Mn2+ efflux pump MntP
MLKLLAFVLPLGLDSFAIAAALGTAALPARQRWRISALFVAFEAGMPLIGLALGAPLAHAIGGVANYLAAAALLAVGIWMLLSDDDNEAGKAQALLSRRGIAVISLGLAISTDELAIGFSLGLSHMPAATAITAIAVQALLASQIGLAVGGRIGERWRERAERLAGAALAALGVFLIIDRLLN